MIGISKVQHFPNPSKSLKFDTAPGLSPTPGRQGECLLPTLQPELRTNQTALQHAVVKRISSTQQVHKQWIGIGDSDCNQQMINTYKYYPHHPHLQLVLSRMTKLNGIGQFHNLTGTVWHSCSMRHFFHRLPPSIGTLKKRVTGVTPPLKHRGSDAGKVSVC